MKRAFYLIILISSFIAANHANAGNGEFSSSRAHSSRTVYQPGEELIYSLKYGFIKGGEAKLMVRDTVMSGKNVHHVVATGKTVGMADVIYKVRDTYESFINPETDLPLKAIRNIREGSYRYYNEVLFEHEHADSAKVKSQKSGEHWVPENIQDIISAFYFARKHKFNESLKEGALIEIKTWFSDELFPLRIRYRGFEVINTPLGKFECYKFSPVTEVGRAFKNEDDMQVWISRDRNKIPVKIRFKLRVGAFTCNLQQFRGLHNPFSSFVSQ